MTDLKKQATQLQEIIELLNKTILKASPSVARDLLEIKWKLNDIKEALRIF